MERVVNWMVGRAGLPLLLFAIAAGACGLEQGQVIEEWWSTEIDASMIDAGRYDASTSVCRVDGGACPLGQRCMDGRCQAGWCGDGVRGGLEECDDGNAVSGDGCDGACKLEVERCGDGVVQKPEECDDANWIEADRCSNRCTINECGNDRVEVGEECDDGNRLETDSCSNTCKLIVCRNGRLEQGEECDDGNVVDDDECTNGCRTSICGNGKLEKYEFCDDGNRSDGDKCPANCQVPAVCGDGVVDTAAGEVCEGRRVVQVGSAPPALRGCAPDCKSFAEKDACVDCMARAEAEGLCSAGYAFSKGCFVEKDYEIGTEISPGDNLFNSECQATVNCALTSGCWSDGNVETEAIASCFCGTTEVNVCASTGPDPALKSACTEVVTKSTRAMDPIQVNGRLLDLNFPAGWAGYYLSCMESNCREVCKQ